MSRLRHFLQFKDFSKEDLDYLFARTKIIKDRFKRYVRHMPLMDRTLVMIFEKASTRTRLPLRRECTNWVALRFI
jgi:ornithine carbamoyltransferase